MTDQEVRGVWMVDGYILWVSPIFWKALNQVKLWILFLACDLHVCIRHRLQLATSLNETRKKLHLYRFFVINYQCLEGLIGLNWGMFVWAVESERVVELLLGYFMNPLMNVFLVSSSLAKLLERLVAVTLAAAGVLWLTISLMRSLGYL